MIAGRIRWTSVIACAALLGVLVLTGCRRADTQQATAQPTLTPTPRSTPLPTLEPTIAPGAADNPIRLLVIGDPEAERQTDAARDFATTLTEASGLAVTINVVSSTAEAVAALCTGFADQPTAAWLDGLGYAAAQTCGTPALWIEREVDNDESPFLTVQLVVPADSESTGAAGLAGVDFCRVGLTDYATWRVPLLLLHAGGLDPAQLGEIRDLPNVEAVLEAVAAGDCAAGMAVSDYEALARGALRTDTRLLSAQAEVPHSVLIYAPEVPLGARLTLDEALVDAARDADFELLLNASGVRPVTADDLEPFTALLERTGLDFAQLGN